MAGWHHRLNGMGLSKLWVCDGQGGLACCDSWGRKESDRTERLNCFMFNYIFFSPSKKVLYFLAPLYLLGAVPQNYLRSYLLARVLSN